jgi:hypothetical protein
LLSIPEPEIERTIAIPFGAGAKYLEGAGMRLASIELCLRAEMLDCIRILTVIGTDVDYSRRRDVSKDPFQEGSFATGDHAISSVNAQTPETDVNKALMHWCQKRPAE